MRRTSLSWIPLCILPAISVATNNLVANWQSATYFYQNRAIHYYYFDLQTQGGLAPAGSYQVNCQIISVAPSSCVTQLLTIPNQQNAIQQCLGTPAAVNRYCLLFSPCQNNPNCNTVYYQSSNCRTLTVTNQFNSPWYSIGRFYYLVTPSSRGTSVPPSILCNYAGSHPS